MYPKVIAAQRIEAFRGMGTGIELAEIARLFVMLKNHLLVEVRWCRQANSSLTLRRLVTSASISSGTL